MKFTCTTLLCLLLLGAKAQNYACLFPGMQRYYTNSNNYLRGIRIDSVRTLGTNTYYHSFKTLRSLEGYRASASWLGAPVYSDTSGIFYFGTRKGDTVKIKTHAGLGESWPIYDDSDSNRYIATVTAT